MRPQGAAHSSNSMGPAFAGWWGSVEQSATTRLPPCGPNTSTQPTTHRTPPHPNVQPQKTNAHHQQVMGVVQLAPCLRHHAIHQRLHVACQARQLLLALLVAAGIAARRQPQPELGVKPAEAGR